MIQYADPSDEPISQPYDQTFEDYDLSVEEWKGTSYLLHIWNVDACDNRVNQFSPPKLSCHTTWALATVRLFLLRLQNSEPKTLVAIPPTYSRLDPDQKSREYLC